MVEPTRIFVLPAAVCSAHEEVNKLHQCLLDDSLMTHDALEIITLMTMLVYGTDSVHAQLLHGREGNGVSQQQSRAFEWLGLHHQNSCTVLQSLSRHVLRANAELKARLLRPCHRHSD